MNKKRQFLKYIIVLIFIFITSLIWRVNVEAVGGAPSVYIRPYGTEPSDIVTIDWYPVQTPINTYWAVHSWNQNDEANGYAGFQQRNTERTLHFAMWDPIYSKEAIRAEYLSQTSKASRFGGEGTGLKIETNYQWKNQWYRMTMRSWQENGHTKYGQWLKDCVTNQWMLVGIMDFPVSNLAFNQGQVMFQEDWTGNGYVRESRLKNSYGRRLLDKKWISWSINSLSSQNPTANWDGDANLEYAWIKSGINVKPSIVNGQNFIINQPIAPAKDPIVIRSKTAYYSNNKLNISWQLAYNSSPQFKAQIDVYDIFSSKLISIISNIKPYQNSISQNISLDKSRTYYINITITDIFDNKKTEGMYILMP